MTWLFQLQATYPVAQAIGIVALVCMAGMALGSCRVREVRLGTAGVLFVGIVVGHFGKPVDEGMLDFVKELGLILFVFTIGLQTGPGFFAALRRQGTRMNALAASIVVLGALSVLLVGRLADLDPAAMLGVFSGASVNMPSLGAVTQTLSTLPGIAPDRLALPALACAVTFPAGIAASILTLLFLKTAFGIDPEREAAELAARERVFDPIERRTLVVTNPNVDGLRVDAIPGRTEAGVTVSRVRHGDDATRAAIDATVIRLGDRVVIVGTRTGLDRFGSVLGRPSDEDLALAGGDVSFRRVAVTEPAVLGRTVREIDLDDRFGIAVTRIARADIEMAALPGLRLQYGDTVQIVGRGDDLENAAKALGDSLKELDETHFVPFFLGILLGVVVGTMPIVVPGLPQPIRLGLAGGPLVVALVLGRLGHIGRLVGHMPASANLAFREFGIALFFAAVGLDAGASFFVTVFSQSGLRWLLAGICVTALPLLAVGIVARVAWKMSFVELSGLLAGSTTNPPALAFATSLSGSDAPTVTYATVYPLSMILRIVSAQVLALILMG